MHGWSFDYSEELLIGAFGTIQILHYRLGSDIALALIKHIGHSRRRKYHYIQHSTRRSSIWFCKFPIQDIEKPFIR